MQTAIVRQLQLHLVSDKLASVSHEDAEFTKAQAPVMVLINGLRAMVEL